jgi:RHS repeat-associated protein
MFPLALRNLHSTLLIPALLPFLLLLNLGHQDNHPPVAVDDSFTVHGCTTVNVTANDSDPDNDPISVNGFPTLPQHASIFSNNGNGNIFYCPVNGYVGSDSFVYQLCDPQHACSNATVTLNVANQGPNGVADFYNIHGFTVIGPFLANDSDPDGDSITCGAPGHNCIEPPFPQHGTLNGVSTDRWAYTPAFGYTGSDSLTYNVCDGLGLCTLTTVNLSVNNNPPIVLPDIYLVPGPFTLVGPFMSNDFDPDNDDLRDPDLIDLPQHGTLTFGNQRDTKRYTPNPGFSGLDSFSYRVCDSLGGCSPVVSVYLIVVGDGMNNGATPCNSRQGGPVNVTNGNMYLQQDDYVLRGVGYGIDLNRTYNSKSQQAGLFGRGWSTAYDATLTVDNANLAHLMQADGRIIYFWRSDTNGPFSDFIGDLHQQLTQTGNGFTLTMKDGSAQQFNSAGRLLSLSDRNGSTTSLSYNTNGFLTAITDPFGRTLTVNSNTNGQISSVADSLGTVATYAYGGSGELLSVTYADNSAYNFAYDGSLRLRTVTDALANVVESHSYDGQGRATTSEKQGGVDHYSFNYVSDSETDVTDGLGRVTKYTVDKIKGRNLVTRMEGLCSCGGGSNSQVQTWTYDNQLNVTAKTDALNHVTSYTYDAAGNRLTQTDPTGTITYTYNGFAEVLTRADQLANLSTNTYDASGNLLSTTDALNNVTSFTHNSRGQTLTTTDARGKVTTFTYDASGNLTKRKDALNHETNFDYDARARLTSVTNALNQTTNLEYDPAGRMKKMTYPDSSFVSYTYDLAGRRTRITDARGNDTNYTYDNAYRLTGMTDALSHATAYGYDAMSNLTSTTDALSRETDYEYDAFNRLVKITYPAADAEATRLFETIAHDDGGNVTSRTDTAGRVTNYAYDNVNRLTSTTDAAAETTTFAYDALSRVTSLTDALNQQYQFVYDALGRQTSMTRAGVSMSYVFDAVGNRTQRTDYNGATTNYTFDDLNRLTAIGYPNSTSATYGYDALSRMTSATNQNGTVAFSYDNRGRVSSTTDVWSKAIGYSYDPNGNRTAMTLNGSTFANYAYDSVNRVTQITDNDNQMVSQDYDATNKMLSRGLPNGVTTTYGYDGLNRLTNLQHAKGETILADNQYTYNTASQIAELTDAIGTRDFEYDAVDRLTSVTGATQEQYSYDVVGNRLGDDASYAYDPFNRLTGRDGVTYNYDANGNESAVHYFQTSGREFTYDFENRLTEVSSHFGRLVLHPPPPSVVHYKYDALGRRIERTGADGSVQRFVYDKQDVIEDLDGTGNVRATYLNGPGIDDKIRQNDATGGIFYFLTDHLGSTRALTDGEGVVEQIDYDSFGNSSGSALTRYDYTGRERDPDTGLMYYRARWYDPQAGRFISEDPIGFRGGDVDLYSYVKNRPTMFRDPGGLRRCSPIVGGLIGAGAGGVLGLIGGELAGAPVGGAIGVTAGGPAGGIGGVILGGLAGPPGGFLIGATGGAAIGIAICNGGDDAASCPMPPPAIPIPYPTPDSIPWVPPPPPIQAGRGWTCTATCNIQNFGNVPWAPDRVSGVGSGPSEDAACRAAKAAAVASAPLGTYARHCQCACGRS